MKHTWTKFLWTLLGVAIGLAWVLSVLSLVGCSPTEPNTIMYASHADPKVIAELLAQDLDDWDTLTGVRCNFPIVADGDSNPHLCGGDVTCDVVGRCVNGPDGQRSIYLNTEKIFSREHAKESVQLFRMVLFHELTHAHLTCTDADHSRDPAELMYPIESEMNLYALPTDREIIRMQRLVLCAR